MAATRASKTSTKAPPLRAMIMTLPCHHVKVSRLLVLGTPPTVLLRALESGVGALLALGIDRLSGNRGFALRLAAGEALAEACVDALVVGADAVGEVDCEALAVLEALVEDADSDDEPNGVIVVDSDTLPKAVADDEPDAVSESEFDCEALFEAVTVAVTVSEELEVADGVGIIVADAALVREKAAECEGLRVALSDSVAEAELERVATPDAVLLVELDAVAVGVLDFEAVAVAEPDSVDGGVREDVLAKVVVPVRVREGVAELVNVAVPVELAVAVAVAVDVPVCVGDIDGLTEVVDDAVCDLDDVSVDRDDFVVDADDVAVLLVVGDGLLLVDWDADAVGDDDDDTEADADADAETVLLAVRDTLLDRDRDDVLLHVDERVAERVEVNERVDDSELVGLGALVYVTDDDVALCVGKLVGSTSGDIVGTVREVVDVAEDATADADG